MSPIIKLLILLTILFNQVGYYPHEEKIAVIESSTAPKECRLTDAKGHIMWRGKVVATTVSPFSGKQRYTIDFTPVSTVGQYTLVVGKERVPVSIAEHPLHDVLTAALHAYYLQRSGEEILPQYAGIYARPLGHPDTLVLIHPSAAGPKRQAGDIISSPRGWYDAGDYNKYVNNSAFSVGILLNAWEMQTNYLQQLHQNIPEQHNSVPDYLDEVLVNLQWMLTMQDPDDGGVYHKLTTPHFEEHIAPTACHQARYVVQKSTPSTLGFAAAMAMAARIYAPYPETRAFAQQALTASQRAFAWAVKHPYQYYDQPGNNIRFEPEITTGMYEDTCALDEFFWAATELYITTQDPMFERIAEQYAPSEFSLPTWGLVYGLATYSAVAHTLQGPMRDSQQNYLLSYAQQSMEQVPNSAMHTPHGNQVSDFFWGSNGEQCAGQGIALMMAYRLTADRTYRIGALENMDWLLGRNALGFCFVTGLGQKQVLHPHHRLSASDGIAAPLPGFLVGGPNPGQQDKDELPEGMYPDAADECYLDYHPSYATNEVTINWNAYLVSLCSLLDAQL